MNTYKELTTKEKVILFLYKWLCAWATLLDGFIGVITLGTVWSKFAFLAIKNQVIWECSIRKNK